MRARIVLLLLWATLPHMICWPGRTLTVGEVALIARICETAVPNAVAPVSDAARRVCLRRFWLSDFSAPYVSVRIKVRCCASVLAEVWRINCNLKVTRSCVKRRRARIRLERACYAALTLGSARDLSVLRIFDWIFRGHAGGERQDPGQHG